MHNAMQALSLQGKVVIVTGGVGGIGRATIDLAEEASVVSAIAQVAAHSSTTRR